MGLSKNKKILVIDDSNINLLLIEAIFDNAHFELQLENNSINAISSIEKNRPDIILLDLMMPGVNGFDILKKLKNDPLFWDISVLVISALKDSETIKKVKQLGALDFIGKPIDFSELYQKVEIILNC